MRDISASDSASCSTELTLSANLWKYKDSLTAVQHLNIKSIFAFILFLYIPISFYRVSPEEF